MSVTTPPLTLSWRIGVGMYEADDAFERLRAFLRDYRAIVDEIAFFETITGHLYLPLATYERRADVLRRRMPLLKRDGVRSVGINVLTTIGHLDEGWDCLPPLPFPAMVGHDGRISRGCACPNTAAYRDYVTAKYRLVAGASPDFIWVDDDIRMHNHGVAYGCFCDACLQIFSAGAGRRWNRGDLVRALREPSESGLREAWVEQNEATIASLMRDVEGAIHGVSPAIATGLMTTGFDFVTYSGQFTGWFTALGAAKARPGGGCYTDAAPLEMARKALSTGRQVASLPPSVRDIQYEHENCPYALLGKSVTSILNECALALGVGVNGITFNVFAGLEERRPLMEAMTAARPCWEEIQAFAHDLPMAGVWQAWSARLMARRKVRPGEDWFGPDARYSLARLQPLLELGLPVSAVPSAAGTLFSGKVIEAFSDAEIERAFSGGVLMDTAALDALAERGYGDLAGVRVARRLDNGVKERLTRDPLNGPYAGVERNACIDLWGSAAGLADVLEPLDEHARVLARMETLLDEDRGPCVTAFENRLGGRVVVMGYAPWIHLGFPAKREQLLNAADWAARGTVPVRIGQVVKLIPFVRLSADRNRGAVVLLNAGFDTVTEATLHVRAPESPVRLARPAAVTAALQPIAEPGGWRVTISDIPPGRRSPCSLERREGGASRTPCARSLSSRRSREYLPPCRRRFRGSVSAEM